MKLTESQADGVVDNTVGPKQIGITNCVSRLLIDVQNTRKKTSL
jgi:hypothetical protein